MTSRWSCNLLHLVSWPLLDACSTMLMIGGTFCLTSCLCSSAGMPKVHSTTTGCGLFCCKVTMQCFCCSLLWQDLIQIQLCWVCGGRLISSIWIVLLMGRRFVAVMKKQSFFQHSAVVKSVISLFLFAMNKASVGKHFELCMYYVLSLRTNDYQFLFNAM